jgi:hypothetical protein
MFSWGERMASVASRVRGSPGNRIVKNYAGHHTIASGEATVPLLTLEERIEAFKKGLKALLFGGVETPPFRHKQHPGEKVGLADTHLIHLFKRRSTTAANNGGAVATDKRISDGLLAVRTV